MSAALVDLLDTKLASSIAKMRDVTASLHAGKAVYQDWIVVAGEIARLAEELDAVRTQPR